MIPALRIGPGNVGCACVVSMCALCAHMGDAVNGKCAHNAHIICLQNTGFVGFFPLELNRLPSPALSTCSHFGHGAPTRPRYAVQLGAHAGARRGLGYRPRPKSWQGLVEKSTSCGSLAPSPLGLEGGCGRRRQTN